MACLVHSECPTGQYCLDRTSCTYDCRIDTDCGSNQRCTSLGMCEARDSGGCSCRVNDTAGLPLTALLGVGLLLARRRYWRRRPRHTD
jgi:MYXO-CTERM domain-containing protein